LANADFADRADHAIQTISADFSPDTTPSAATLSLAPRIVGDSEGWWRTRASPIADEKMKMPSGHINEK
jgi:hypothetical protein